MKQIQRKTGNGKASNVTLQKFLQNLRHIQRKTGGGTTSNETLQNILQSSHDEPTVEEKKVDNHANSKEVKKILKKMLQSLHEESEESEEEEEKEEKDARSDKDIENEIFEDVTLEEKKRFYKLLNELKSRKSRIKGEDFQKIDKLIPQYFKNEYGIQANGLQREKESFSDQINQELRTFQQELPLISLEMQIILTFMDKKRKAIKDLLQILKSDEKEKSLERKYMWNDILEDEYNELKKDLSKDTIARVLSNRIFKPMDSEHTKYG